MRQTKTYLDMYKSYNKIFLSFIIGISCCLMSSCSGDDDSEPAERHPSHRDRVYTGDKLCVTVDGIPMSNVVSAEVRSEYVPSLSTSYYDAETSTWFGKPVYDTVITIVGFPQTGQTTVLNTQLIDLGYVSGDVTADGTVYSYEGTFTGNVLGPGEEQALQIEFKVK